MEQDPQEGGLRDLFEAALEIDSFQKWKSLLWRPKRGGLQRRCDGHFRKTWLHKANVV